MRRLLLLCMPIIGLICVASALPTGDAIKSSSKCGYESCHPTKDGFINVHIVPHTHDDVGWLKTVDQYYYGSQGSIQKAGVQYIIDTVIEQLARNKDRKFIYVESAFFFKWWDEQDDDTKNEVIEFVNNGQLEFIGGGWSMNDEATVNYQSTIDQMTWGLRKLNDTFGECGRPKIGWQIDPFGHSKEQASIFAQLGFDAFFLGRIDQQEKNFRFSTKTPEMIWRASQSLGEDSEIFTEVLYNRYSPPSGFNFDILHNDLPIIDNPELPDYNVDDRVNDFFKYVKDAAKPYPTNNILVTMGEDFNYQDARTWYKNLDKLIYYSNLRQENGSNYHLLYSTPSCYAKAISEEAATKNISFLVKTDDFFPYGSDDHAYWTGYFTSRPAIKRFERIGNNFLQVCKQLSALTNTKSKKLDALREAMGILQHHDAITGTEKQAVANDYARLLFNGIKSCEDVSAEALNTLGNPDSQISFSTCLLANISQCSFTEKEDNFVVTLYNPLSKPVTKYVRLPVLGTAYTVTDPNGDEIDVDLVPIAEPVLSVPGRDSKATVDLVFRGDDIPPLGFKSYFVQKLDGNDVIEAGDTLTFTSDDVTFAIDEETGIISEISMYDAKIPVTQEFLYYSGYVGDNDKAKTRSSGAYVFRPNGTAVEVSASATVKIYNGKTVTEVQQTFNTWVSQVIRVYADEGYVEFNWLVGPIPNDTKDGIEVVSRFSTELDTKSVFYTDSNGRQELERVRDSRRTWNLSLQEPVSGNYYPVTSKISLLDEDATTEFAVLTDRAQGGGSLADGEVELMVHRRCNHDDSFGVGEALKEEAYDKGLVVRGSHYVIVAAADKEHAIGKTNAVLQREVEQQKLLDTWVFLSSTNGESFEDYKEKNTLEFAGLQNSLPENVHLLTLEPWKESSLLLRLEHLLEKDTDPNLGVDVTVDLNDAFSTFKITSIRETTLGANQWLEDNERLSFASGGSIDDLVDSVSSGSRQSNSFSKNDDKFRALQDDVSDLKIVLSPKQIRTFIIEIEATS